MPPPFTLSDIIDGDWWEESFKQDFFKADDPWGLFYDEIGEVDQPGDSEGMIIVDPVLRYRIEDSHREYVAMSGCKVWIDKLARPAFYASGGLDNFL